MKSLLVIDVCCGGLFIDDIVLCALTSSHLKKLLKLTSKWAKNNENAIYISINVPV